MNFLNYAPQRSRKIPAERNSQNPKKRRGLEQRKIDPDCCEDWLQATFGAVLIKLFIFGLGEGEAFTSRLIPTAVRKAFRFEVGGFSKALKAST